MRTTLTLDDDIAEAIDEELRRRPHSTFKEVVNDPLRCGLHSRRGIKAAGRFIVKPRSMDVRRGINYDDIGGFLEELEGSIHR